MAKVTTNAAKTIKATSKAQNAAKAEKASKAVKAVKVAQNANQTPYRQGSCYQAVVDALKALGLGKVHSFDSIIGKMELPSGFKSKEKRNEETGKSWKDRCIQNIRVVARKDYGAPLRKTGFEVRTDGAKGAGLYKLGK